MVRGNPSKLKVPTSQEARENGRKGGIASAKARAAKRDLQRDLKVCIETALYDVKLNQQGINQLKRKGVKVSDKEELNGMTGIVLGLMAEAMKGNASSAKQLMDMMGISPAMAAASDDDEDEATGIIEIPSADVIGGADE